MAQTFTAPSANNKADILFVVDTTPTMYVSIIRFANALGSVASLSGIDFQIGVLNATMNSYDGSLNVPLGELMGMNTFPIEVSPTLGILSKNVNDPLNNYVVSDDWILSQNLSFSGSTAPPGGAFCTQQPYCTIGPAQPLKAITAMIANKSDAKNANFFRAGSVFVPIIVTASDENGGGPGATQPSSVISAFNSSLGSTMRGMKAFSVLVEPGDSSCLSSFSNPFIGTPVGGDQMYGQLLNQFVTATGGSSTSICSSSFSSVLSQIPTGISPAPLTSVTLSQAPLTGTVKVTLSSGALIGYTVSGTQVTFNSPIPPGTSVTVSYLVP